MQKIPNEQLIARYLKSIKGLTTNKLLEYCWENNLNRSQIEFVKKYINGTILYTL